MKTILILELKIKEIRARSISEEQAVMKAAKDIFSEDAEVLILETKIPDCMKEELRQKILTEATDYLAENMTFIKRPYRL